MQLYAITSRSLFPDSDALLACVAAWAKEDVDFVQVREKDLPVQDLMDLTREIVRQVRKSGSKTSVLLNGPAEVARTCGCDGVHLPSGLPADAIALARRPWQRSGAAPRISVSCHTSVEIEQARVSGATLALFAPVFEKSAQEETLPGQGLRALAEACQVGAPMPVFALGGVTARNAAACIRAGAAGIAGIRLFASGPWRNLLQLY